MPSVRKLLTFGPPGHGPGGWGPPPFQGGPGPCGPVGRGLWGALPGNGGPLFARCGPPGRWGPPVGGGGGGSTSSSAAADGCATSTTTAGAAIATSTACAPQGGTASASSSGANGGRLGREREGAALTGDPFHSRPAARSFVCRRATGLHANTRFWGGAGRRLQPLSLKRAHGGRGARGGSALPPTAQTPPRPALHIQNMCAPGGGTERSQRGPSKSQVASRPASWPLFYFARCRALPRPRPLLPPPATSSRHLHPLRPPPSPSHPLKR